MQYFFLKSEKVLVDYYHVPNKQIYGQMCGFKSSEHLFKKPILTVSNNSNFFVSVSGEKSSFRGVITTKATKAAALVDFWDYNKL